MPKIDILYIFFDNSLVKNQHFNDDFSDFLQKNFVYLNTEGIFDLAIWK